MCSDLSPTLVILSRVDQGVGGDGCHINPGSRWQGPEMKQM